MWDYLENLSIEKCHYHPEVVRAILRKPQVRIPAIFYGHFGKGNSFQVTQPVVKEIDFRVNDGTDIRFIEERSESESKANFHHGNGESWKREETLCVQIAPQDWLAYNFRTNHQSTGEYTIAISVCAPFDNGKVIVSVDGNDVGAVEVDVKTEGWSTIHLGEVFQLEQEGNHRIIITAMEMPLRVEWIEIREIKKIE